MEEPNKYEQNHERFLTHLNNSESAVWVAAKLFYKQGCTVEIKPPSRAKHRRDWKNHVDDGDLEVTTPKGELKKIEVKRLGVDFTGLQDWPFYSKFIICAKHSYDKQDPKPALYLIFSNNYGYCAFVNTSTCGHWYVEKRKDSRYIDIKQEFYFCPINLVAWRRIGNDLVIINHTKKSDGPRVISLNPAIGTQMDLFKNNET